jgi:acyl-coenzyme A synthetase/AMP-(fatty) acid ligase
VRHPEVETAAAVGLLTRAQVPMAFVQLKPNA